MDYSLMFYIASVSDKFLNIILIVAIVLTVICFIALVAYLFKDENNEKEKDSSTSKYGMSNYSFEYVEEALKLHYKVVENKKKEEEKSEKEFFEILKILGFFSMLCWSLYILIPSKNDILLIVGGGQVLNYMTNDSTLNEVPKELSTFVLNELKNLNKENDDNDSTSLNTMLNINEETK